MRESLPALSRGRNTSFPLPLLIPSTSVCGKLEENPGRGYRPWVYKDGLHSAALGNMLEMQPLWPPTQTY